MAVNFVHHFSYQSLLLSILVNIYMCNDNHHSQYLHCTDNTKEDTLTNGNERYCEIFIGLTGLFTTIATAIIVVLSWKLYNQHKKKGDVKN